MTLHGLSPRAPQSADESSRPQRAKWAFLLWFWTNRRILQQKHLKALFVSLQQILLHTLTWLRLIDVHWTTCGWQRLQLRPGETNPMCASQFYFFFLAFCCGTDGLKIPTDWECPTPLVPQKQTERLFEFMYCWFWKRCTVGNSNHIVKFIWSRDWARVLLHVQSILFISKRCCYHNGSKLNKCLKKCIFSGLVLNNLLIICVIVHFCYQDYKYS